MITSAGILLYRLTPGPEVLIAHMGGPYWSGKDAGAWSIPKGEFVEGDETALDAAHREFEEELGVAAPDVPYAELGTFAYSSGKRVTMFIGDGARFEAPTEGFGEFELEWPPRSGRKASFPEVDRAEWASLDDARERLVKGQRPAIDVLEERLRAAS
ncbi:NUDIX domain-containing protein [Microbacterium pumilum]|uniref:NUDIX domain-containing protein n=1 Tax=Microbacterium pumilum TaxID=344165 RepID=A0ABN2RUW6_9MICO